MNDENNLRSLSHIKAKSMNVIHQDWTDRSRHQLVALACALLVSIAMASAQHPPPPEDCDTYESFSYVCGAGSCWYYVCQDWADMGSPCPSEGSGEGGCCGDGDPNAQMPVWVEDQKPTSTGQKSDPGMWGAPSNVTGGMPFWYVEEPSLRLYLKDKPFFYQTSRQTSIELGLYYKSEPGQAGQVDARQYAIFGVGTNWSTPWRSYLQRTESKDPTTTDDEVWYCFLGDGTARKYPLGAPEYLTRAVLTKTNSEYWLTFPSGARNVYGQWVTLGGNEYCFLSRQESPEGSATQFTYSFATAGSVTNTIRLQTITDPDGRDTTFVYHTNNAFYSNLISQVNGPYGLTASLGYNSQAQLTNLTDVIGLSSGVRYGANGLAAFLDTPYGTTSFSYLETNSWKAVRVEELGQRRHLYLRGYNATNALSTGPSEGMALNSFLGAVTSATVQTNNFDSRCTFRWGPRQYEHLPLSIRTNLANVLFDPANLSTNDFKLGWTSHWLRSNPNGTNEILSVSPSVIREPSPSDDGSVEGLLTWFDYEGKSDGKWEYTGKRSAPLVIASREPGGEWRVSQFERNSRGNPTVVRETITSAEFDDGWFDDYLITQWRTNWFSYAANGLDRTEHWRYSDAGASVLISSNAYNEFHQIVTNFNAVSETTMFEYNGNHQITKVTRPSGLVTELSYDGNSQLTSIVDKNGATSLRTNSYTWTNGYVLTHTNPRGLAATNSWDALGRLTKRATHDGAISHSYGKLDRVKTIDRMGFTYGYAYNGFRQLTYFTNANSKVWTNTYCDCGSLETAIDPLGNTNSFSYDNQGRRLRRTFPDQSWAEHAYDLFDQPVKFTDSAGINVTNVYSIRGMPIFRKAASGILARMLFDANDRLTNHVDQNGVLTALQFDALDRILTRETLDGASYAHESYSTEIFGYSSLGLVIHSNQLAQVTLFEYDLLGRRITETNANGEITRFKYDANGSITNLIDGKGNNTYWKYDLNSRATNKTDAVNVVFTYAYDANGRLISRWSAAKGTTTYGYDSVGNLTAVNYPSRTNVMAYDANNRLISMSDGVGTTTRNYTSFGALQSEDGPWADDTVSYSYSQRQRTGLSIQHPSGPAWSESYAYDHLRRLTNVTSPAGAFGYSYRSGLVDDLLDDNLQVPATPTLGNLVRILSLPSGAYVTNSHDVFGRLTSTALRNSGHTNLNLHSYDLNVGNQRTNQTRLDGSNVGYTYDDIGQLRSALGFEPGGTTNRWQEQFYYTYDAAGNLSIRVQNVLTNVFNVNSLNQLTSVVRTNDSFTVAGVTHGPATNVTVAANGNSPANAIRYADSSYVRTNVALVNGNNTFTAVGKDNSDRGDTNTVTVTLSKVITQLYDLNGNLRTNGTRTFDYDEENQLTCVTEPNSWKAEFVYDGWFRRRIERNYRWANSVWVLSSETRFIYDGRVVIQERNQFNLPALTYTRGKDLSGGLQGAGGIGGLLAMTEVSPSGDVSSYYHSDGNGNVTAMISTNQEIVARYVFDPFGNTLAATGDKAAANRYRFSSKPIHEQSGMYDYLYRWYIPELQRWLTRDPVGHNGGVNLFRFVKNSPLGYRDDLGLVERVIGKGGVRNNGTEPVLAYNDDTRTEYWVPPFGGETPTGDWDYAFVDGEWIDINAGMLDVDDLGVEPGQWFWEPADEKEIENLTQDYEDGVVPFFIPLPVEPTPPIECHTSWEGTEFDVIPTY